MVCRPQKDGVVLGIHFQQKLMGGSWQIQCVKVLVVPLDRLVYMKKSEHNLNDINGSLPSTNSKFMR